MAKRRKKTTKRKASKKAAPAAARKKKRGARAPKMHAIEKEIVEATGQKPQRKGEEDDKYLKRLVLAVDKLPDKEWNHLSEEAQAWHQAATSALNADDDLPGFDEEFEEPEEEEEEPEEEPEEEEEEEPEEEEEEEGGLEFDDLEEGMTVSIVNKDEEEVRGEVTKLTKSSVTITDEDDEEWPVKKREIESITDLEEEEEEEGELDEGEEEPEEEPEEEEEEEPEEEEEEEPEEEEEEDEPRRGRGRKKVGKKKRGKKRAAKKKRGKKRGRRASGDEEEDDEPRMNKRQKALDILCKNPSLTLSRFKKQADKQGVSDRQAEVCHRDFSFIVERLQKHGQM